MSNKSSITNEEVAKVANLAKIKLSEGEVEKFKNELSPALEVADSFKELDTTKTTIMSHATGSKNILRDDTVTDSLDRADALKNAVKTKNGYILIQRNSKK